MRDFMPLVTAGLAIAASAIIAAPPSSAAGFRQPANHVCRREQLELFSCEVEAHQTIGLCLDESTLGMEVDRKNPNRSLIRSKLSNVREATIGMAAHGAEIVLEGKTRGGSIDLFVDFNFYDGEPASLVTKTERRILDEPCRSQFVTNRQILAVHGVRKSVALVMLQNEGVVPELKNPPDSPD